MLARQQGQQQAVGDVQGHHPGGHNREERHAQLQEQRGPRSAGLKGEGSIPGPQPHLPGPNRQREVHHEGAQPLHLVAVPLELVTESALQSCAKEMKGKKQGGTSMLSRAGSCNGPTREPQLACVCEREHGAHAGTVRP